MNGAANVVATVAGGGILGRWKRRQPTASCLGEISLTTPYIPPYRFRPGAFSFIHKVCWIISHGIMPKGKQTPTIALLHFSGFERLHVLRFASMAQQPNNQSHHTIITVVASWVHARGKHQYMMTMMMTMTMTMMVMMMMTMMMMWEIAECCNRTLSQL